MIARRSMRVAGVAAFAAAALGVALTPVMATVAVVHPDIVWSELTPVERTFGPLLESTGALTFGTGDVPYRVYGKAFFVVYLLMLPIVRLVHVAYRDAGGIRRFELWSWRAMHIALLVALVGDVVAYWALSIPGAVGDAVASAGFVIEVNGMVTLLVATAVYAGIAARYRVLPRWAAWLFIATVPIAWLTGIYVVGYIPNAFIVPLSLSWAAIGVWLVTSASDVDSSSWPMVIDTRSTPERSLGVVLRENWVTALCGLHGSFMIGLGLLVAADPGSGVVSAIYGSVGVLSGLAMLAGVYLMRTGRLSPARASRMVGVAAGVAAVGYAWVVVPVAVGGVIVWEGVRNRRLRDEVARHQDARRR